MEPAAPTLDHYRDQIAGVLNRTAIDIGSILIAAKHAHPRRFMEWVEAELPFSYPKIVHHPSSTSPHLGVAT